MNGFRNQIRLLALLVKLELSYLKSERWILLSCLAFCLMLSGELFLTARDMHEFRAETEHAESEARQNWLNQGDRDPHGAAHHGTFLFKPVSPLGLFEPGLFPYSGTTIRIEAHTRHRLTNRPAENAVNVLRNSFLSPAALVQGGLPLLLILLGCGMLARERQQKTLPLIRSLGVPWGTVVLGKACSLWLVALGLSAPYWGTLLWTQLASPGTWSTVNISQDVFLRALLLLAGAWLYLLCWSLFIVAVSARTRTGSTAFTVLLVFWSVTTFCLPPLATNLVAISSPSPTQEEAKKWSDRKKYGDDSSENIFRTIREDLEKELLAEHNVDSIKDLPFNFDGLYMMAAEEATDEFAQQDANQLARLMQPYERAIAMGSYVSPYLAMHRVSMSLAGTDEWHHNHFDQQAEAYRRHLVLVVNQADSQKETPDALRGTALWEAVREFQYQPPSLKESGAALLIPVIVLTVWLGISLTLLFTPVDHFS